MGLNSRDVWGHFAPMFHLVDAFAIYAITLVGGRHAILPTFTAQEALLMIGEQNMFCTCAQLLIIGMQQSPYILVLLYPLASCTAVCALFCCQCPCMSALTCMRLCTSACRPLSARCTHTMQCWSQFVTLSDTSKALVVQHAHIDACYTAQSTCMSTNML